MKLNDLLNTKQQIQDDLTCVLDGASDELINAACQVIVDHFAPLIAEFMETTFTDAPESYDGFGTKTVRLTGEETRRGPVREVQTPKEHALWQRGRYGSGMCYCLDAKQYEHHKPLT